MPEDLLRKYRPLGPPAALRGRILGPDRVAWPWAVAAAALLVCAIALHTAAVTAANRLTAGAREETEHVIADLTGALGGTPDARALAETVVLQDRLRRAGAAQVMNTESR